MEDERIIKLLGDISNDLKKIASLLESRAQSDDMNDPRNWVSAEATMKIFSVSRRTLYSMRVSKKLTSKKIRGQSPLLRDPGSLPEIISRSFFFAPVPAFAGEGSALPLRQVADKWQTDPGQVRLACRFSPGNLPPFSHNSSRFFRRFFGTCSGNTPICSGTLRETFGKTVLFFGKSPAIERLFFGGCRTYPGDLRVICAG